jgi:hypothetical protein
VYGPWVYFSTRCGGGGTADALGSGPSGGNPVEVQILFAAPMSSSEFDWPLVGIGKVIAGHVGGTLWELPTLVRLGAGRDRIIGGAMPRKNRSQPARGCLLLFPSGPPVGPGFAGHPAHLRLPVQPFLRWLKTNHPDVSAVGDVDVNHLRAYRAELVQRPGLMGRTMQPESMAGIDT